MRHADRERRVDETCSETCSERERDMQLERQVHPLAHEVLQNGALAGALPPHHGDLRQIERRVLADGGEGVLQPVHQRDQFLHAPVPHDGAPADRQAGRETSRNTDSGAATGRSADENSLRKRMEMMEMVLMEILPL